MANLDILKEIYLDGAKSGGPDCALDGLTSTPAGTPYSFIAGDTYPIKVYFRAKASDGGVSTALTPTAGSTCVVAGKSAGGSTLLFSATLAVSGDFYTGTIDLNTDTIATAMSSLQNGQSIDVYVDFEVRNAGVTQILTYRATCKLYKQTYAGETAPSSVVTPPAILVSPDGSRWQLSIDNNGAVNGTKVA